MRPTPDEQGDRATSVLFRMSHAEKDALRRDADQLGISVQALLERRVLGKADAVTRHGARPKRQANTEDLLPLTG